jgi:hypothetical protein
MAPSLDHIIPAVEHVMVFMYFAERKIAICEDKKLRNAIWSEHPVRKFIDLIAFDVPFVI